MATQNQTHCSTGNHVVFKSMFMFYQKMLLRRTVTVSKNYLIVLKWMQKCCYTSLKWSNPRVLLPQTQRQTKQIILVYTTGLKTIFIVILFPLFCRLTLICSGPHAHMCFSRLLVQRTQHLWSLNSFRVKHTQVVSPLNTMNVTHF